MVVIILPEPSTHKLISMQCNCFQMWRCGDKDREYNLKDYPHGIDQFIHNYLYDIIPIFSITLCKTKRYVRFEIHQE